MKNVVIGGAGEVGRYTAEVLYRQGHAITVIDTKPHALKKIENVIEARLLHGSSCDADILKEADIEKCDVYIAATSLDEINLVSGAVGRRLGAAKVIARVHERTFFENRYLNYSDAFACDHLICPEELTSKAIGARLYDPDVVAVQRFADDKIELHQFVVKPGTSAFHKPLAKIPFPPGVRLIIVKRDRTSIIPDASTVLARDDLVTVVMPTEVKDEVRDMFNYQHSQRQKIALAGATPMAEWILSKVDMDRFSIRLFEPDLSRAEIIASRYPNITVLNSDPVEAYVFESEHLEEVSAFIACGFNEEHNILGALQAKAKGAQSTFAIIHNSTYLSSLGGIGIDHPFSPRIEAAKELLRLIDDEPIKVLGKIETGDVNIYELTVGSNAAGVGKSLKEIAFPRATIIAAIKRGHQVMAPSPQDIVHGGDTLIVIGPESMKKTIKKIFIKE